MTHVVIYQDALSFIDEANLRDLNREHNPVIVTMVETSGYSRRYKLREEHVNNMIKNIPEQYLIKR